MGAFRTGFISRLGCWYKYGIWTCEFPFILGTRTKTYIPRTYYQMIQRPNFNDIKLCLHVSLPLTFARHASSRTDWYKILDVSRDADQKTIKQAYFKMAKKYHPDSHPNDSDAKERFQAIAAAYDVLGDETKKREYDASSNFMGGRGTRTGSQSYRGSFDSNQNVDAEEMFDHIFGKFSEFTKEKEAREENDAKNKRWDFGSARDVRLSLSFVEAARGVKKNVELFYEETCSRCEGRRAEPNSRPTKCDQCSGSGIETIAKGPFVLRQTCRHCNGSRTVHKDPCKKCSGKGNMTVKRAAFIQVPAGVEDGQTIRTTVDGREYFLTFTVEKSKEFRRQGSDVHSDVAVSLSQAVLGGVVRVHGLYDDYRMNVPPGTQSHEYIFLKGKGMKRVHSSGYGDHYVHVKIKTPTKLSVEQLALLSTFAETETETEGTITGLAEVGLPSASGQIRRRVVVDESGIVADIRRAIGFNDDEQADDLGG